MSSAKYECAWVGIDSGREGLWREPIWRDVLRIVADHQGERVYDEESQIYQALEKAYPKEAWRSHTAEGVFRPLFRDYPNSWTRTGVVSLKDQRFHITELGQKVLSGTISKSDLLVEMFKRRMENSGPRGTAEKPFSILASGILAAPRALSTQEIYWAIMKNYRPGHDDLPDIVKRTLRSIRNDPESTPYRRLRNMLTLMRTAGAIASTRRGPDTIWSALNVQLLKEIAREVTQ
ncbi:MAG: hypothetical protein JWM21_2045 [Acidobacteria bacterium]|nr:hypothetical protein [Acidobacteriota bacterium]